MNVRWHREGTRTSSEQDAKINAPLGKLLRTKGQQLERWVEPYADLFSRQNTVAPSARAKQSY